MMFNSGWTRTSMISNRRKVATTVDQAICAIRTVRLSFPPVMTVIKKDILSRLTFCSSSGNSLCAKSRAS